jgi:hypothetical protein
MKHKNAITSIFIILTLGVVVLVGARSEMFKKRQPAPQISVPTFLQAKGGGKRKPEVRNLSLQREAIRLARTVGKRFDSDQRSTSVLVGTLKIGSEQKQVQTRREQTDSGEKVEIKVAGGGGTLTWDANEGVLSAGSRAGNADRDMTERLVLDSPDQFVLAQLRGASYATVATNVRQSADGPANGQLWNVVRVNDPQSDEAKRAVSSWRLYYINVLSGLIDRIVSDFHGQQLTAEFTWTEVNGEKVPAQIRWTSQGQLLMEYQLQHFAHVSTEGGKQ